MTLSNEQMIDLYTNMARIRMFEERVAELFAAGKIPGFVHLYVGEEAVATGVSATLRDSDYITSTHRGHGHLISKGGDMKQMMAELLGKKTGYCKGKGGSCTLRTRIWVFWGPTASLEEAHPWPQALRWHASIRAKTMWPSVFSVMGPPTRARATRP